MSTTSNCAPDCLSHPATEPGNPPVNAKRPEFDPPERISAATSVDKPASGQRRFDGDVVRRGFQRAGRRAVRYPDRGPGSLGAAAARGRGDGCGDDGAHAGAGLSGAATGRHALLCRGLVNPRHQRLRYWLRRPSRRSPEGGLMTLRWQHGLLCLTCVVIVAATRRKAPRMDFRPLGDVELHYTSLTSLDLGVGRCCRRRSRALITAHERRTADRVRLSSHHTRDDTHDLHGRGTHVRWPLIVQSPAVVQSPAAARVR